MKGEFVLKKNHILRLFLLVVLIFSASVVFAQELPDTDGDFIPDQFDGCPNESGLQENYGCPAGVTAPDSDGDTLPDVVDTCPELAGSLDFGGCLDSDGDRQPDPFDSCPQELGLSQNFGCPLGVVSDRDGDGVADRDDICTDIVGEAALAGCSQNEVTDNDGDGVADIVDACFNEAGSAENGGCPDGTAPDWDFDGVANADDACPRQSGTPENNGCFADADQDLLDDRFDACPDQPGDSMNQGCPAGVAPPDSDGDIVPDIYDRCPDRAGVNGMDCPDSDGDNLSDVDDVCPQEAGDPVLSGCVPVFEITLPTSRAPITTANAASLTEFGQMVTGVSQITVASTGLLAIQTYNAGLQLYDLNAATLTPRMLESLGSSRIALSSNGTILIDTPYDMANNVPAIQIWDTASSTGLNYVQLNNELILSQVTVTPDGSKFATAHSPIDMFAETDPNATHTIRLWDTASASDVATLPFDVNIYQIAYHPDGNRLVVSTRNGTSVWDTSTQQQLGTMDAVAFAFDSTIAFSPDGGRVAIGEQDGTVSVWDMNSYAQLYEVQPLQPGDFGVSVSSVAFSPDGSLLAVGGGPFADGFIENPAFQIVLLDASNGTAVASVNGSTRSSSFLNFSPDGTMLIFAGMNTVEFWGVPQ